MNTRRGDKGFTLVELLIVIAIIGVLAAVAVPVFLSQTEKAETAAVEADLNMAYKIVLSAATADPNVLPLTPITAGTPTTVGDMGTITPSNDLFFYGDTVADLCIGSYTPAYDLFSGKKSGVAAVYCAAGATTDADNDSVSDLDELLASSDPLDDQVTAGAGTDTDGDGYSDTAENYFGTDPNDNASIPDDATTTPGSGGSSPVDSDSDGYSDADETAAGSDPNDPASTPATVNPTGDFDGDGYTNADEITAGSDPNDATSTPATIDTDGDNIADVEELSGVHGYVTDPNLADTDGDGLNDDAELWAHGTDPTSTDTDGDGFNDNAEIYWYETDPTTADTPADADGDNVWDKDEVETYGTNPNLADTDGDGFNDDVELFQYSTDPLDPASMPLVAPTGTISGISASGPRGTQITVNWSAYTAETIDGYDVIVTYYNSDQAGRSIIAQDTYTLGNVTTYVFNPSTTTGVNTDGYNQWVMSVRARNGAGAGPWHVVNPAQSTVTVTWDYAD